MRPILENAPGLRRVARLRLPLSAVRSLRRAVPAFGSACPLPLAAGLVLSCLAGCQDTYTETGDLPALQERGVLRVLVPEIPRDQRLPREGHPFDFERELAAEFAGSQGLEVRWQVVEERDGLLPALLEGRGDLIAAGLTVTEDRQKAVAFSRALSWIREQVVTRAGDTALARPADLAGRTLALRRSSAYWGTAERLAREHPGLELEAVSEGLETEEILYRVERGLLDLTMADDNLVAQARRYMPDLRVAFDVTGERPTAMALRADARELKTALDAFLQDALPETRQETRYTGDLSTILDRGVLRVLTRNSAATYFIWRGRLMGFEYDLARRFAESLGVRLEMVVPPTRSDLLPWLKDGYGDLVAAGLTATREREAGGVAFTRPYHYVVETVVGAASEPELEGPEGLAGRTVAVRRESPYWSTARDLQEQGIDLELVAAPDSLETEAIIDAVARGVYDLTIADSHILDIELTWRDDVKGLLALGDSVAHAWAVRPRDTELLDVLDAFFEAEYRGRWFNITYNKYFETEHRVRRQVTERPQRTGRLSPFDELFRTYGQRFGFDWRLVAAQAFQESGFDPRARSFAGAVGIMQVMPETGSALGFQDLLDPEEGIHAGTRYLDSQYERFEDVATETDRLWFALASYNAGYGHVADARRIASEMGRNPDRWFTGVAPVMPLLARPEYHRKARYGYCRCQEPVRYVRKIRETYQAYREATEAGDGSG